MTEKPIIFSAPMIRAMFDGRKTQTRRIISNATIEADLPSELQEDYEIQNRLFGNDGHFVITDKSVRYQVGDRLWVREAWRTTWQWDKTPPRDVPNDAVVSYEADGQGVSGKLRSSMFMPRWASRLTDIVTDVKVERLQDISRGDAMEEGCPFPNMSAGPDPRHWYSDLWDQINGPGAWDQNPLVAAYTFRVIKANIDSEEARNG